jgi:hypothetical protein
MKKNGANLRKGDEEVEGEAIKRETSEKSKHRMK